MWIKTKERLPPQRVKVMARNPFHEAVSWIDGLNECGKPSWYHESWDHADDFVVEWRYLNAKDMRNGKYSSPS